MPINITNHSPAMDRNRRELLGLGVDDVAAQAGITPQELTTYEQAKSEADANPAIALKVQDALDVFEREIVGRSEVDH